MTSHISKVDRIKQMVRKELMSQLLDHFKIETSLICQVHLVDIKTHNFVWDDTQLEKTRYYLAFSRLGSPVSKGSQKVKTQSLRKSPLLSKRLFQRVTSSLTIKTTSSHNFGRVEVLEPDKTRKMEYQFLCPFLDCAKVFKRSCDLLVHFRVEVRIPPHRIKIINYEPVTHSMRQTGERPFQCGHCNKLFRRKILLTKHLSSSSCTKDSLQLYSPEGASPLLSLAQNSNQAAALNKRNKIMSQKNESFPRHSHSLDIWECSHCKSFFSNPMTLLIHSKDCMIQKSTVFPTPLSKRIIMQAVIQMSKNEICSKLFNELRQIDLPHRLLLCSQILHTSALMGVLQKLLSQNLHY